jgi:hypothetical protein
MILWSHVYVFVCVCVRVCIHPAMQRQYLGCVKHQAQLCNLESPIQNENVDPFCSQSKNKVL